MGYRMRLILLGFFLVPGLVLAKPKAPEAQRPVASWTMTDEALSVVLKAGTVEQISALPGVNGQAARFIIRLRAGKADYQATDQSTEFKGLETAQVERVLRLLGFQTTSEGLYSQNTPDGLGGHNTPRVREITSRPTFEEIRAGERAEKPVQLNLNMATAAQLAALDGIGPRLAEAIVALRIQKGGAFKRLNELTEVEGIDADKLARLKPHFNLGDTATHE